MSGLQQPVCVDRSGTKDHHLALMQARAAQLTRETGRAHAAGWERQEDGPDVAVVVDRTRMEEIHRPER